MPALPLPEEVHFTHADLLSWDDGIRYELYSGVPMAMSSPSDIHQEISMELSFQLHTYLRGKKCRAYYAPLDVRLFEKEGDTPGDVDTVVQPDLMVVCDSAKVDRHGVHGAPDLVVEILSDSTRLLDQRVKFTLYQKAGVREYWIVDPGKKAILVYRLEEERYRLTGVYDCGTFAVDVLEGCVIDVSAVFPNR